MILSGCGPSVATVSSSSPALAEAAINDATRPEADRARDAERRPAELLALSGVKPGDSVVEVWPGPGYWTRLFSSAVGKSGRVLAYVPRETVPFRYKPLQLARATAAEPGRDNVAVSNQALAMPIEAKRADIAWTAQNYHDLHNIPGLDIGTFNRNIFRALKPGGTYVVIDHAAPAGWG